MSEQHIFPVPQEFAELANVDNAKYHGRRELIGIRTTA
jgi:hypothetical protein